jgi:hypothetical protein
VEAAGICVLRADSSLAAELDPISVRAQIPAL